MTDAVVVGAGLAGLAAGRDLHRAGLDVLVLEARDRPGGRVEQAEIPDGRTVQLGGEVVGDFHTAYLELVAELGLTLRPSYVDDPGEITYDLVDGTWCGDEVPWMSDADRADGERLIGLFAGLAQTVDPDDPWSHPDAERLDRLSINAWMREMGAAPNVLRLREAQALSLSGGSGERISLLSALRMDAVAGALGTYDLEAWENQTVAEGSARVPLRMAAELGDRVRLSAPVRRIAVDGRVEVVLASGAGGLVCAADDLLVIRRAAPDLVAVVPGIRPAGSGTDDQARAATPEAAVANGAESTWFPLAKSALPVPLP